MRKLDNKIAIIIGASRGIGEGIAKVYSKYGATVMLVARGQSVFKVAQEMRMKGFQAEAFNADISKSDEVGSVINKVIEKYGRIDILVNNAGVCRLMPFNESDDDFRDYHIDINIKGIWNVTRKVIPYMIKAKYGRIINFSSVTGIMVSDPGETAYSMTKAAIIGFTKALAREVAEYNITVNAVCPGTILTSMVEGLAKSTDSENPQKILDQMSAAIPIKRMGTTEEVGELVAFLGSDESTYITGTNIVIDGGSTLPETACVEV